MTDDKPTGDVPGAGATTPTTGRTEGDNFIGEAKNFIKNPLGIIGLFIMFVYAIATIVIGVYMARNNVGWQQPFTWFIVTFPFVVLFVFRNLVINHHLKLYAPSEIPDIKPIVEAYAGIVSALATQEQQVPLDRHASLSSDPLRGQLNKAKESLGAVLDRWPKR